MRRGLFVLPGFALVLCAAMAASAPSGGQRRFGGQQRPAQTLTSACSNRVPVCVHIGADVPDDAGEHVLATAEKALGEYLALGLPHPVNDAMRGGSSAWDVYILAENVYASSAPNMYTSPADVYTNLSGEPVEKADFGYGVTLTDPETEPRAFDGSAAFTLMPAPATRGCDLDFAIAKHAAKATLLGFDGGAERVLLDASASYLAWMLFPCTAVTQPAVDAFQAEPHKGFVLPAKGGAHGAFLFPMYLEENEGSGDPAKLTASLFAIASQRSAPSPFWQNEPDLLDALRSSLTFRRASLEDVLLDFAVDRAFVGDRSDGQHLAATDVYAKAGRVFFEWSVPYNSLPRRLAPAHPLLPTGATYLWLDLATAPKDSEVTFVADWELPAVFRWSLVKVDKQGAETGRIDIAGVFGTNHVERTVVLREDLAGMIVVGTFTGSLDRSLPFDPDEGPFMPHSYEVTLYGPVPTVGDPKQ
ncbi:MAG: hypothetical protein IPK82_13615 [Polyangiaceae bacterium]|nr:hypothetical protein [Polyangiaceae bacterium]